MNLSFTTSMGIFVFYAMTEFPAVNASSSRLKKRSSEIDIPVCQIPSSTLEIVDSCPSTNEAIRERSLRKNCQIYGNCEGSPLVYHCAKYKNRTAEVCAPKRIITGHCCVEFNSEFELVVEDYEMPCPECPFHYPSNESLLYSTCNANSTCKGQQNNRHKRIAQCNENLNESTGYDQQPEGSYMVYVLVPVAVLVLLVGALVALVKHRKKYGKDELNEVTRKDDPHDLLNGMQEDGLLSADLKEKPEFYDHLTIDAFYRLL